MLIPCMSREEVAHVFTGERKRVLAKEWEKERMVLGCVVLEPKQEEERGLSPLAKKSKLGCYS